MRRYSIFIVATLAMVISSCKKEMVSVDTGSLEKVFTVNVDETRTTLESNGASVLWSDTDVITVIAASTGNEYDFTIETGAGEKSATFKGTLNVEDAEETTFYAVYPNIKKNEVSGNVVKVGDTALGHTALAVKDGIDPAFMVMAAKSENGTPFSFKHGMSYCKIAIAQDGITKVKLSVAGNGRVWGRPNIDVTDSSNTTMDKGKSDENYMEIAPLSGTLEQGNYFIPVTVKNSSLGNLSVEYTKEGITTPESITTSQMSSVKMQAGKVYDLGCPPISFNPVITVTVPSKLDFDAESGAFAYSVKNPIEGEVIEAVLTEGDWISNIQVGEEFVTFDCTKNDSADAEERLAVITLSYEGAVSVPVTVKQGTSVGVTVEEYDWNFTDWDLSSLAGVNSGEDIKNSFTENGLTFIPKLNSGSKWGTASGQKYIQTGGKNTKTTGSDMDAEGKLFKFNTQSTGTVTVTFSNTGNNSERKIYVKVDDGNSIVQPGTGTASTAPITVSIPNVPAGVIRVFSENDSVRIFRIQFSNQ